MLPFPSNIGIIAHAASRRLGCIAFRLTAVAAVAANLDLEATASSSDVVLLCCSRLAERHGRWDELACGGGGLIRSGAAVLTRLAAMAQFRPNLWPLAVPSAAACRGTEARASDEARRPVAHGRAQVG